MWRSVLTMALVVTLLQVSPSWQTVFPTPEPRETESEYWLEQGRQELEEALHQPRLTNRAKNVIMFLGDGMGVTATTAGRIRKGQKKGWSGEEEYLVWDRFPNVALVKTYNLDRQVPDSAGTATAFFAGVKANYYTLGVNGKVAYGNCEASLRPEHRVDTILKWAQDAGKETGMVTTAQVTHATPAALYATSPNRYWQCDTKLRAAGPGALACKDIARQLVEDDPGRNIKVVLGGGRQEMGAGLETDVKKKCVRTDGRNLVSEWRQDKESQGASSAYVTTTAELRDVDVDNTEYIMGLFGDIHVPYEVDRNTNDSGTPHIKEMVKVALKRLQRSKNGFFLMVEGGRIDHGLHHGKPHRALDELVAMEEALVEALKEIEVQETLVVVTADHSHVMTMNGYPIRGNDIFGTTINEDDVSDHMPYTTLMFTNGEGFNYTWTGNEVVRPNLTGVDTTHKDYVPLAAVPTYKGSETHGGEDVAVYAMGPMAHLFHRVHEQSYVAHVMGYAACIGPYREDCDRPVYMPDSVYNHVKNRHPGRSTKNGAAGVREGAVAAVVVAWWSVLVQLAVARVFW